MYLKPIARGLATWIPYARKMFAMGTGGSTAARYCYSVWLRHLVMAHESHQDTDPHTVAELGPGDSLGTGLCAMLTGADSYLAFDVVSHANAERNSAVLEELIELLARRTPIPDDRAYPKVDPLLRSYAFPHYILTEERLERALAPERLNRIRSALRYGAADGIEIKYANRWVSPTTVESDTVDLVFSQAVLEHVENLPHAYAAVHRWLRPGGLSSSCIDFRCHTLARQWNGNWGYSDAMWRMIRGNRPFLLNREPVSTHRRLLHENGLAIVGEQARHNEAGLKRDQLAPRFRDLSEEDLTTESVFIQAVNSPG